MSAPSSAPSWSPAVTWLIQTNLGDAADIAALQAACAALGLPCRGFEAVPFSDALPELEDAPGPVVFYGAARLVAHVVASGRWWPGGFFDPERFRASRWLPRYAPFALNASATWTTLREAAARSDWDDARAWFVRPDGDLKEFAGAVMDMAHLRGWAERLEARDCGWLLDVPILVAPPVEIDREWRVVVVDGVAVAGSRYRSAGRLDIVAELPDVARALAERAAAAWAPAPVFVLDVAQARGEAWVLEVNGFNSAGLYACDPRAVVAQVSRWVEATWQARQGGQG